MILLLMCGDVEANPGPVNQGSQPGRSTRQSTLTMTEGTVGLCDIMRELRETRSQVNEKIDALGTKLDERYTELEGEIVTLKGEFAELKVDRNSLRQKVDDLENRARRNNVIIHGIEEDVKESWLDTEEKACRTLQEGLGLEVDGQWFERVHRVGKPSKKGRPIMALCSSFKRKAQLMQAAKERKPEGLFINDDFSVPVREARKKLGAVMKQKREAGHIANLRYNKLIVKSETGKQNIYMYDEGTDAVSQVRNSFQESVVPDDNQGDE